jgi:ABC-2 type transport system permease protein
VRNFLALARRELGVYFVSPTAYVILTAMLALSAYVFISSLEMAAGNRLPVDFSMTLSSISFIVVVSAGLVTMRLVAEEKSRGTLEIALTAPVTETQFVLGKFAATLVLLLWQLVVTGGFVLIISRYGRIDLGAILCGYFGVLLVGAAVYAMGLFISSLCVSQVTAGMITFVVSLMLLAVQIAYENPKLQSAWFLPLLRAFALTEHMNDFMRGVVDTGRLVTLACVTGAFLFLTVRVVESRRWR